MSFTRFNNDTSRVKKRLQESTDIGRYMLNVPGNGDKPLYMNDPHIRLQKWGGNAMKNPVALESKLFGLDHRLDRDCYKKDKKIDGTKIYYSNGKLEVGESRITHPIWEYRELDQTKTNILPLNPQENTELSFNHNLNTRLSQMDDYNSNNNNI